MNESMETDGEGVDVFVHSLHLTARRLGRLELQST